MAAPYWNAGQARRQPQTRACPRDRYRTQVAPGRGAGCRTGSEPEGLLERRQRHLVVVGQEIRERCRQVRVDDPWAPDERLVVGNAAGRRIHGLDRRRGRITEGGDGGAGMREPERRLRVGSDDVQVIAPREAGHRCHEHAHEPVGSGDEAAPELAGQVREPVLEIRERACVAAVDRAQRRERRARGLLAGAGRNAAAQQRASRPASGADGDRLEPDVLIEHDQIRAAGRQVRQDFGADRTVDRVGIVGGRRDRGRALVELDREHAQRVQARVGGDRRTTPTSAGRRTRRDAAGRLCARDDRATEDSRTTGERKDRPDPGCPPTHGGPA